jgi:2',3'-cyclic-nucleotide 2'-phosphodiesterase (5'-nucleotidase family)
MKEYMMITRVKTLILFLLFPWILVAQTRETTGKKEIIILHVNDMHSKIDNMAKLSYLADSLRQRHRHVYLVSAGDNFTGNPVVDQIPEKGAPMIDLMNRCGFNVSAIGNHEFDMGQEMLNKRIYQAAFRFICANLDATGAVLKQPEPFYGFNVADDIDIAFLGLLQLDKNGLPSAHPANMTGIKFMNGIEKAQEYASLKETYEIMIALSHLGVNDDTILAKKMPQFDAIIGGHTHTLLEKPLMVNNVMVVQTGANLKYVGKLTLVVENGKVTERREEIIPFSEQKKENLVVKMIIDKYNNNKEFARVVGYAEKPLEGYDQLGSLMTDALTHELKADFAFQNRGGIRIQSLNQGDITLKDIYKLDPFNNEVMLYSMSADEISSLICYGYQLMKGIDLQVSGMTYKITGDGHYTCKSVEMSDKYGKPLDPKAEYLVAVNNYVATTYQFRHKDPGTMSRITTAEALIRYLGVSGKINYEGTIRAMEEKE